LELLRFVNKKDGGLPELGAAFAEPTKRPLAMDEGVDEGAFVGGLGLMVRIEIVAEGFELGGIFTADDKGLRVDAGFEGVGARYGFACAGAGSGGLFAFRRFAAI
jgi:hypothetical protein